MRIVIAGMGDVGYHLAKQLSNEEHDIIAIDMDQQRLTYSDSMADILTINGSSTSVSTLKQAKVNTADLFVAVTSFEEVNVTSAIIAKKLGAKKTIARISNSEYLDEKVDVSFSEIGIESDPTAPSACALALAYLELAAPSRGLGCCWAGYLHMAALHWPPLQEALALPAGDAFQGALMVGEPRYRYHRLPLRREPVIAWR